MRLQDQQQTRRGTILPLLAVTCFALFGFVALSVDIGMLMIARTECQNAADTAALTGARTLDNDYPVGTSATAYDNKRLEAIAASKGGGTPSPANSTFLYYGGVKSNYLLNTNFTFNDSAVDKTEIGIYDYDAAITQTFQPKFPATGANPATKLTGSDGSVRPWTAVRVTVKGDQPTYFARLFGVNTMPMSAIATAVHRPRDISFALDFSGSMQFGSRASFPPGSGDSNGRVLGLLNPDTRYPRIGHYGRYDTGRQTTNPNNANAHPFHTTGGYVSGSGEFFSPNNHTTESSGGPPQVNDYYTYPTTNTAVSDPSLLKPAFNNTLPGGSTVQVCPISNAYALQNIAAGTMQGDRYPRRGGVRNASTDAAVYDDANNVNSWRHADQGAAQTVRHLLFTNGNSSLTSSNGRSVPTDRQVNYRGTDGNTYALSRDGGDGWRNYLDLAWERNGYDLDIPDYITSKDTTPDVQRTNELFSGYTLGPGYWGKTFFIWPPDPRWGKPDDPYRTPNGGSVQPSALNVPSHGLVKDTNGNWICDWRRRFFLKADGTAFNPQIDNINTSLFSGTAGGHVLNVTTPTNDTNSTTTGFRVNYAAVMQWLKTGPRTLPNNLRAGRILYYDAMPDDCTNPANDNERFWREYIDFVLGVTANRTWYNPAFCLAGTETSAWGTFSLQATLAFTPTNQRNNDLTTPRPNPKPYMCYSDTPNMPRAHFWFGPSSMLMFISTRGGFHGNKSWNWTAGTVREAQSWQLKAAIQSGIEDVRRNHPNDQVGMAFFAHSNFRTPRVGMGQQWDRLKAALFYPNTFITDVINENVREERPYDNGMNARLVGNIPNANGATDPNNGLAQAYNMFSPTTSLASGAGGRRGAAKIVIFETDGVPNSTQNWDFAANGFNSRYNWVDAGNNHGNGSATSMNEAYDVASQIAAPTTSSAPGFSLPNAPARIYSIAFGDLFSSTSSFRPTALTFLQTVQFRGNALASASTPLPTEQVITGDYTTRINNLRTGLERIFQNGVQVALVE
jgi:hypothetical protein